MIEWDKKYSVNVSMIDEEHKKLIGIINKAISEKQHNNPEGLIRVLNEMIKYSSEHFKTEESYMIEFHYPEYQYHKEEHQDFYVRTLAYKSRIIKGDYHIAKEILEYIKQWLVDHIQNTDKKYTDCFNKNGLR